MLFKQMPNTKEVERPWQADIDRLQQTLQEVLEAISNLSGVELTTAAPDSQASDNHQPTLDCKSLKDRIRNDLENFAAATASEMARQAERQTRVALAAIHSEANGHVEQVAKELREKLQGQLEPGHFEIGITQQTQDRVTELVQRRTDEFARWVWLMCKGTGTSIPVEIEKLLEPYVEEATGRFTESFRERFEKLIAEQEQLAQSRVQGAVGSLEQQIGTLDQAAKKICEQTVDSVARLSADRLNGITDESARKFESRIRDQILNDFTGFQASLEKTVETVRERFRQEEEERARNYSSKIEELEAAVEEKAAAKVAERIEQTSANVIESSVQRLHQQASDTLERSREELKGFLELQMEGTRLKINTLGQTVQESLLQEAERRVESLKKMDHEINFILDRNIADSKEQISSMVHGTLESMKEQVRQISEVQLEGLDRLARESRDRESSQYASQLRDITDSWYNNLLDRIRVGAADTAARVTADIKNNSDSVMQELSDKVDAAALVLREETAKATSQIESLLKSSLESYQQQLGEISVGRLEDHRQSIRKSVADLQARLERSAQILRQEIAGTLDADQQDPNSVNQAGA